MPSGLFHVVESTYNPLTVTTKANTLKIRETSNCETSIAPGALLSLVQLGGAAGLFAENVVDELEGLLKHDLRGDYPLVGELVSR